LQLVIWVLRLSFFSTYLTDSAVTGLTFGAAIHALTAQIKGLLGIHLEGTTEGFLQLFEEWLAIAERVPDTNLVTLAISISTIVFLLLYKELVEPHLRRKRISLPAELLVVSEILVKKGFVSSHMTQLPAPRIPRFERVLIERLIVPAISIAVVSYAVTVSMGKLFARKHKYHIDPDQEMLALGIAGTISSFFLVFPTSTSLSRSLVNERAGARTQVRTMQDRLFEFRWGPSCSNSAICLGSDDP
ncbi:inorganic anion transporter, SulP family, partial [Cooperia oncophora]